jgi:hypothetical protein
MTKSDDNLVNRVQIGYPGISDHHAVTVNLSLEKPHKNLQEVSFRRMKNINMESFTSDIKTSALITSQSENIDELVDQYNTVLSNLLDKHAPLITKTFVLRPDTMWYNEELRVEKRKRRRLERRWRRSKLTVDKELHAEQCHIVSNLIKKAKCQFYAQCVEDCHGNPKALFSLINKLFGQNKSTPLPSYHSIEDLTRRFNTFFVNKISNIRQQLSHSFLPPPVLTSPEESSQCSSNLSSWDMITDQDLNNIIRMSPKKTCSLDPLPTWMLCHTQAVLFPVIRAIINKSLECGYVPLVLKAALVTPILKKATLDQDILNNYRPVSNLCFLSKTLERVVAKQLNSYLLSNNLREPMQSAYTNGHSTETALVRVQNDILCAMDQQKYVILLLLDLSAAFDTVDHQILLNRLHSRFGITGLCFKWIKSYIDNRTQQVSINNKKSEVCDLQYGVPQGSVLGPVLFTLYTTPLGDILRKHEISFHLYADDCQIYCTFTINNTDKVITQIEHSVDEIRTWMRDNMLKLNDNKTEVILFGNNISKSFMSNISIKIGADQIHPSLTSVRNLGVLCDNNMNSFDQISKTCKSAFFHLHRISKISKYLTTFATKQLIHSLVISRLDYNNALLIGLPQKSLKQLQKVQNCAARLLTGSKSHEHITPVLKELHWLPVESRITFKVLLLVYKAIHTQIPSYIHELLKEYIPPRTLRSSDHGKLIVPHTRTKRYGERAFSYAAPKLWNNLPINIRKCQSIQSFKTNLKTYLFNKYYS